MTGFWIFLVAGLGGRSNPSKGDINGVVASVILYSLSFSFGWAPAPYATASEIASNEVSSKVFIADSSFEKRPWLYQRRLVRSPRG